MAHQLNEFQKSKKATKRRVHDLLYYQKQIKRINCTLTKKEFAELKKHAKKTGCTPTKFLRLAAFAYTRQEFLLPTNLEEELHQVRWFIRNIADNINQIATHTNTIKNATIYDLKSAEKQVDDLETAICQRILNPPLSHDRQIIFAKKC